MCEKRCSIKIFVYIVSIFLIGVFARNAWSNEYVPNVHWVFCIDTSGSMKAKGQMDLLKEITQRISNNFINPEAGIIKIGDRITLFSFDQDVRMEATSLYQTENDLLILKHKLKNMNERRGSLTFISESIVRAIEITNKYNKFFHTNALYVFTDGQSEPYSPKWPKEKIEARKKQDQANFNKISLSGKEHGLNVWLGVLKWEAFKDAKKLVDKMGKGGHFVDLTDFNRLSVAKALMDYSHTVRINVRISKTRNIDFGTIPYRNGTPYQKNISLALKTDNGNVKPAIMGHINFDPENPTEIAREIALPIKTTEDKIFLNFSLSDTDKLKRGKYKGKLKLYPSRKHFGALVIEPAEFNLEFKKSGFVGFYAWKVIIFGVPGLLLLFYVINKVKRKMPIKI
ncbi:MAG: vWA domain-containing protein [Nitrospiria bacterium]